MRSKRHFRLVVVVTVVLSVIAMLAAGSPALAFSDVPSGHAYEKAINDLATAGIVSGYLNGNFGLDDPVKRAQFAKMIVGALHLAPGDTVTTRFTDLGTPDVNGYPHRFVQAAYDHGITYGTNTPQTLFDPWKPIRRDQVVSMIVRGANSIYPGKLLDPPAGTATLFASVPEPHGQNLRIAEYNGLLSGLIGLGPEWSVTADASRGEVAEMVWNLLNNLTTSTPVMDVTVNADGSGDYPTLQDALTHVPAGATIHLSPGVFTLTGTATVASSCTLLGAGTDAAGGTAVRYAGDVIDVERADLTAQHLRFESTTTTGNSNVMTAQDANLILEDCYFTGGNKVDTYDGHGDGLRLEGTSSATMTDCTFTANDEFGFALEGTCKALIQGNHCTNNGESGMMLWGDSADTASGNTCTGNTVHGIAVSGEAHAGLQENVCSNNGYSGIDLSGQAVVTASHNTCDSNYYDGINCWQSAQATLEHNTCRHNRWNGISFGQDSGGSARYNECSYSEVHSGIDVEGNAQPVLENNTCLHNQEAGLWYTGNAGGSASGNECGFGTFGIYVEQFANPTLGTNNLHDNTRNLVTAHP